MQRTQRSRPNELDFSYDALVTNHKQGNLPGDVWRQKCLLNQNCKHITDDIHCGRRPPLDDLGPQPPRWPLDISGRPCGLPVSAAARSLRSWLIVSRQPSPAQPMSTVNQTIKLSSDSSSTLSEDTHTRIHMLNRMQPEMADFAPGAATQWTRPNIGVTLSDVWLSSAKRDVTHTPSQGLPIRSIRWKKWCHPQNCKYITYRTAVRKGPSHGHRKHTEN